MPKPMSDLEAFLWLHDTVVGVLDDMPTGFDDLIGDPPDGMTMEELYEKAGRAEKLLREQAKS